MNAGGIFPSIVVDEKFVKDNIEGLLIADVRWNIPGRSTPFEDGHLPGAISIDLEEHLTGELGGVKGRHPLPTASDFAKTLGSLGIKEGDSVVVYDDAGSSFAGRFLWMLASIGQPVAVLDGGLKAWSGTLERGAPSFRASVERRVVEYDASFFASVEEVADRGEDVILLDARPETRYRGEGESLDAKVGHIAGARNLPWASLLEPSTGRYLDAGSLRSRFASVGVTDGMDVIASCGSGVTACPDLIALSHAGLGHGRLYVGSFSGWSSDPDRPIETGS